MRRSKRPLVIASRPSPLAQAQARAVGEALLRRHPHLELVYRWVTSEGDQRTDRPLQDLGGKGLFAGAVERSLLAGEADIAVHSLKDLPVETTPGLMLAAIPKRHDVRDVLVTRHPARSVSELPQGATFGTSSPRRAAQVCHARPDLRVTLLRGNVETRLDRVLAAHQVDATLVAAAGLHRLGGYDELLKRAIPVDAWTPAAGQGALAIQCRGDDHVTIQRLLPLNHVESALSVHAERLVVAELKGDCHSAIAVYAQPMGEDDFLLRASVWRGDGSVRLDAQERGRGKALPRLARQVGRSLLSQGAHALLRG